MHVTNWSASGSAKAWFWHGHGLRHGLGHGLRCGLRHGLRQGLGSVTNGVVGSAAPAEAVATDREVGSSGWVVRHGLGLGRVEGLRLGHPGLGLGTSTAAGRTG